MIFLKLSQFISDLKNCSLTSSFDKEHVHNCVKLKIFEKNIDIIENIHKFKILDKYNDKLIMFVGINTLIQTTKIMYSKEKLENVYNFIYKIQL